MKNINFLKIRQKNKKNKNKINEIKIKKCLNFIQNQQI